TAPGGLLPRSDALTGEKNRGKRPGPGRVAALGARFGHGSAAGDQAALVSQKILEISSILASSSSAWATSTVPFPPAAPASLVASQKSWWSCGYFSRWCGLK